MRFLLLRPALVLVSALLWADSAPPPTLENTTATTEIVDKYVTAVEAQQSNRDQLSMEVDIDAKLPRLKKQGRWHAFKFITRVGQIFYNRQKFEGDNTVKKELIARYLEAEQKAKSDFSGSIAITPGNYKFRLKGLTDYSGRSAYVLQVVPKARRVGLFKGEVWVDEQTYLPLREWGELVKNPSVFLKNVYFVRDYYIYDGMSVPRRLISDVDTRLVGKAQLTIWFDNYKKGDQTATPTVTARAAQATAADQ